jgi:hypothetical protein
MESKYRLNHGPSPMVVVPTRYRWLSNPAFHHHERERVQPGLVLSRPPFDMDILISANGWTINQIGFQWIQHFEKYIKTKTTYNLYIYPLTQRFHISASNVLVGEVVM